MTSIGSQSVLLRKNTMYGYMGRGDLIKTRTTTTVYRAVLCRPVDMRERNSLLFCSVYVEEIVVTVTENQLLH